MRKNYRVFGLLGLAALAAGWFVPLSPPPRFRPGAPGLRGIPAVQQRLTGLPPAVCGPALAVQGPAAARPGSGTAPQAVRSGESRPADPETEGFLTLVNALHPLPESYVPPLTTVPGCKKKLHPLAADALTKLLQAAAAAGVPLQLVSGYRSPACQKELFRRRTGRCIREGIPPAQAGEQAAGWVARPGADEHALGLAADLVCGSWEQAATDLTPAFDTTPQFQWLTLHAAEYGFILRWPRGCESLTGMQYQPWHYRYVGEAAPAIAASGLCLEAWLPKQAAR